ncbi:MAG: hypothetical protein FWC23_06220 [Chitinispirillia bacterium]|nr:hypothetical protein [Chitinispirillia bacterium]MCL2268763.1 hypothetical protein [Chitinispirillia bacterium]
MRGVRTVTFFAGMILLAALVFPLSAQVIVEDEIVTGEVNLFDVNVDGQRSVNLAMGLSAVLPGMGHYYIDKPASAWVYLSVDIASLFGAVVCYGLADQRENHARSFAAMAAGIEKPAEGEAYWRHVGRFMDAAEFNEIIELSRGEAKDQFLDPQSWWRWADESHRDEYNGLRQKARDMRVASSFFIGAMVANRIVSAVDLRVFHRKGLSSGVRFESAFMPELSGSALTLRVEF